MINFGKTVTYATASRALSAGGKRRWTHLRK
jgi:hypothetical protein